MSAAAIILIIFIIVIVAIIIGWLWWRQHKLINVNESNANNPEFLRAYNNLQLIINQVEIDTKDIITASINRKLEPRNLSEDPCLPTGAPSYGGRSQANGLDGCDELFINRYPDRVEDIDTSFTNLKMVATVSSDEMASDGGRKLTESVNTYTLDITNGKNSFDQSVKEGGTKCTGPAFEAVRQTYAIARPNVKNLNLISADITKSLQ